MQKVLRSFVALVSLVLMVACYGGDGEDSNTVSVVIHAEFEKKTLSQSGLSSGVYRPARYCWVEGVDPQTNQLYFSGYLNSSGQGIVDVPMGVDFILRLVARYEVPGSDGDFRIRGSVKDGNISQRYSGTYAFNDIPDWTVYSQVYSGFNDFNITIRAHDSQKREAGAFNIADQAVEFALAMGNLEPGLHLPNLHTFWSPDTPSTGYPTVAYDTQFKLLAQSTGRTIFQHEVMGIGGRWTNYRSDEYNDSALLDTFAHLLFADYSYPATWPTDPFIQIVRRDCEDIAWVEWHTAADTTVAFVNGFCNFLSAAIKNNPYMYDIYHNDPFMSYNLSVPTTFYKPNGGEFHRQSVAGALYRIWKNAFSGSNSGLQTMWDATWKPGMAKNILNSSYPYGYMQSPVGNISSYLSGLANGTSFGVTNSVWNSILTVLNSESISNPNATYFSLGKLWKQIYYLPTTETDSIRTYTGSSGVFWDYDQSKSYYFTQYTDGYRRITLELTGGQDLFLELFDERGLLEQRMSQNPYLYSREIYASLLPGNYVVKVRAGYTSQNSYAGFRLRIQ
ncbi:MAG: hypothetical protein FWG02_03400 [Holophagaceae bacterium]|nr:hypothetical protein [Holophagaceae bacterium]